MILYYETGNPFHSRLSHFHVRHAAVADVMQLFLGCSLFVVLRRMAAGLRRFRVDVVGQGRILAASCRRVPVSVHGPALDSYKQCFCHAGYADPGLFLFLSRRGMPGLRQFTAPSGRSVFPAAALLESFQFETLCLFIHTACRFAEKALFFSQLVAVRRCAASSCVAFFQGQHALALLCPAFSGYAVLSFFLLAALLMPRAVCPAPVRPDCGLPHPVCRRPR